MIAGGKKVSLSKNLLLMAASTVIAFTLFAILYEGVQRLSYDQWKKDYGRESDWHQGLVKPSENDVLLWEYRPNAKGRHMGTTIETNRNGFRDKDHDLNNQPVAFFGDSVTLGLGARAEDTFVRQFEQLSSPTINVSVDGYSALQVMELVRVWAEKLSPDQIVYVMCINDFSLGTLSKGRYRYFNKPETFLLVDIERQYLRLFDWHKYFFEKNRDVVFDQIVATSRYLKEIDIDFRVVVIPVFQNKPEYSLTEVHAEIVRVLSENDISVIDLLSDFAEEDTPMAIDLWHLNTDGHRFVADRLSEYLAR